GGIAAAMAAHLAAPDAQLTLVRVDPASLFQVLAVSRYVRGEIDYSEALQSRITELSQKAETLRGRYLDAAEEYRKAFMNFSDEDEPRLRRDRAKQNLDILIK